MQRARFLDHERLTEMRCGGVLFEEREGQRLYRHRPKTSRVGLSCLRRRHVGPSSRAYDFPSPRPLSAIRQRRRVSNSHLPHGRINISRFRARKHKTPQSHTPDAEMASNISADLIWEVTREFALLTVGDWRMVLTVEGNRQVQLFPRQEEAARRRAVLAQPAEPAEPVYAQGM